MKRKPLSHKKVENAGKIHPRKLGTFIANDVITRSSKCKGKMRLKQRNKAICYKLKPFQQKTNTNYIRITAKSALNPGLMIIYGT